MLTQTQLLPKVPEAPEDISKETYEEFRDATWFKQGNSQHRKKKIAVIGAGLSGLVAAWLLKRADHDVVLYEANNVVGGRVKTIREAFTSGLYAEAGAMRIPDTHKLVQWLVDQFGLELCEFKNKCNEGILHANDKQRSNFSNYHLSPKDLGFAIEKPSEKGRTAQELFDEALTKYAEKLDFKNFKPENFTGKTSEEKELLDRFDEHSLREFLYGKESHLSRAAADMICLVMAQDMHLPMSMAAILNDHIELHHTEEYYRIKGGMDQLPKAFVRIPPVNSSNEDDDLPKEVKKKRKQNPPARKDSAPHLDGVEILYNRRVDYVSYDSSIKNTPLSVWSFNTKISESHRERYDLVVFAIPFSAMQGVRLSPGLLGADKRRAIRQLHYDNSCKIFLEFQTRFWEPAIVGGKSHTNLLIRQTYYPTTNKPSSSGAVLLASYTWGDDSLRWTSLSPENRLRFAVRDLELVHDRPELSLRRALVGGTSHSWAHDEFTSGAFAMFEPYQRSNLFRHVWKPDHLLHFCGEHTSTKHAWMEGAIESGIRVAREICGRIDSDPALSNTTWA